MFNLILRVLVMCVLWMSDTDKLFPGIGKWRHLVAILLNDMVGIH